MVKSKAFIGWCKIFLKLSYSCYFLIFPKENFVAESWRMFSTRLNFISELFINIFCCICKLVSKQHFCNSFFLKLSSDKLRFALDDVQFTEVVQFWLFSNFSKRKTLCKGLKNVFHKVKFCFRAVKQIFLLYFGNLLGSNNFCVAKIIEP